MRRKYLCLEFGREELLIGVAEFDDGRFGLVIQERPKPHRFATWLGVPGGISESIVSVDGRILAALRFPTKEQAERVRDAILGKGA